MNMNPIVDEYLAKKKHPLNPEIQRVREIIMNTHKSMEETIKWSSPTFMYKGNMASFFMNAKKHISLMFHKGALIDCNNGLLQGEGKEARTAKFKDMADIEKNKNKLEEVVLAWISMKDKSAK